MAVVDTQTETTAEKTNRSVPGILKSFGMLKNVDRNWPIGRKLTTGFGVAILFIIFLVVFNYFNLLRLTELQDEGARRASEAVLVTEVAGTVPRMYQIIADTVINRDMAAAAADWAAIKEEMEGGIANVLQIADTDDERIRANDGIEAYNELVALYENEMVPLLANSDEISADIKTLDGRIDGTMIRLEENYTKIMDSIVEESEEGDRVFDAVGSDTINNSIITAFVSGVLLLLFAMLTTRSIVAPINLLTAIMGKLAGGNNSVDIEGIHRKDEIGEMSRAVETFKLNAIEKRRLEEEACNAEEERLESEARIRRRETRFSAILDTANDAIMTFDEKGIIDLFNPAAEGMFGYSADEIVGRPVDILMPDFYAVAHSVSLDRRQRTGKSEVASPGQQVEGLRKGGTTFPADMALAEWESGKRKMFTASLRDMSHQRAVEKELLLQNRSIGLMKRVALASNRALTFSDALSHCLCEICGHMGWPVGHAYLCAAEGPDLLISSKLWHLDDPARFADFRRVTEEKKFARGEGLPGRVLASGKPAWIADVNKDPNFPRTHLAKDIGVKVGFGFPVLIGSEVVAVFEFYAVDALEPDQEILNLMAEIGTQLGRVFERERAEKELRYKAEILSKVNQGVVTISMDGRIKSWNESSARIWGYSAAEVVGEHHSMLFAGTKIASSLGELVEGTDGDGLAEEEYLFKRKSDEEFFGRFSISLLKDSVGEPLAVIAIVTDLTNKKLAEDRLRQSHQLEALGRMAGGVAHEFNNLLLPISTLAELTLLKLSEDSKAARNLKKILMATKRGGNLVSQIMDLRRQHIVQRQESNLEKIVREAVELLEVALPASTKIRFTCENIPEKALTNSTEIHQLIFNLGVNAAHAIGDADGEIEIRLEKCDANDENISASPKLSSASHAKLTVSDSGCGMDGEMIKRAFEPFYTTRPNGKGTGLGLAIVKAIVDGHEGAISVKSQLAVGTTIEVRLPLIR